MNNDTLWYVKPCPYRDRIRHLQREIEEMETMDGTDPVQEDVIDMHWKRQALLYRHFLLNRLSHPVIPDDPCNPLYSMADSLDQNHRSVLPFSSGVLNSVLSVLENLNAYSAAPGRASEFSMIFDIGDYRLFFCLSPSGYPEFEFDFFSNDDAGRYFRNHGFCIDINPDEMSSHHKIISERFKKDVRRLAMKIMLQ